MSAAGCSAGPCGGTDLYVGTVDEVLLVTKTDAAYTLPIHDLAAPAVAYWMKIQSCL